SHEHRDRDRHGNRECAPWRAGQRLHDDQREHREDHEAAEQRDQPRHRAHLGLNQVAERAPVAARRDKQHDEVLHRAGEYDAGQNPQHPRQVAHLRRKHRADQRSRAGDCREMVSEQYRLIGRHIVQSIVMPPCGGHPCRVQLHDLLRDEATVVTVSNQVNAQRGDNDP
ncbi:hypothetical protein DFQ30_009963, partial [Apophysomyces sp. BC1015]